MNRWTTLPTSLLEERPLPVHGSIHVSNFGRFFFFIGAKPNKKNSRFTFSFCCHLFQVTWAEIFQFDTCFVWLSLFLPNSVVKLQLL